MTEAELMETPEYLDVVRTPRGDESRVVLASAIRTSWPERAEFIELQLAERTEERKGKGRTAECRAIHRRVLPLLLKLSPLIEATLPREAGVREPQIERGFIWRIGIDMNEFLDHGQTLVARYPLLGATISGPSDRVDDLAQCEALRQFTMLAVACPDLGDDGLRRLLTSPYLYNLRSFSARGCGLTMRGYEQVVEATKATMPNLESFQSSGNQIDSPQERDPAYDGYSGAVVHETYGVLPMAGQVLEANYGYQKILHWCSRFGAEMEKWPYD